MMTPQLFINYKLKSVAHLPWRMLTYKALNTFIDDLFAFVIKMPMLYRIGCFRDGESWFSDCCFVTCSKTHFAFTACCYTGFVSGVSLLFKLNPVCYHSHVTYPITHSVVCWCGKWLKLILLTWSLTCQSCRFRIASHTFKVIRSQWFPFYLTGHMPLSISD